MAENAGVAPKTVRASARRYEEAGLDSALCEKPRPGQARVLNVGQKQRIVAMVCGPPPEGRARGSVWLITEESAQRKLGPPVSRETIRILLENHELKPWREKMWCIAELSEEYIARMEDVLAIYEKPLSDKEPVVCVDENPVVLHADVRPPRLMRPGRIARRDSEYQRRGTANAFCGVEPKAGRHFPRSRPTALRPCSPIICWRSSPLIRGADTIHLVMDNLSSHRRKVLVDRYGEWIGGLLWDRFTVHYTPKHGSWLNQAEIEISLFSRECLGPRRIPSPRDLRREAQAFTRKRARQKFGYKTNKFRLSET